MPCPSCAGSGLIIRLPIAILWGTHAPYQAQLQLNPQTCPTCGGTGDIPAFNSGELHLRTSGHWPTDRPTMTPDELED